ncbi:hypothetical protein TBR22_A40580 [Luteitalea sp. TBR-22]|uniref:hypothetical protein n=1 Tax=Luteitalea sp. TBR-22 TaxID=2802971 RepID=UPI001AF533F7|nr:hypothetical protein [Luteitalea sp. TBR-22]BCS34832.1 hypothetical protein TBR22_A40580 [Luteitalea sp. TBR-22]
MTHSTPLRSFARACLLGLAVGLLAVAPGTAQERLVLASAQVVTAIDGPPTLRLAASGPLAFTRLLPAEDVGGAQILVRLHGVAQVDLATRDGLAPFTLSTAAGEGFVDLTIVLGMTGVRLDVRPGRLPHEIEFVVAQP